MNESYLHSWKHTTKNLNSNISLSMLTLCARVMHSFVLDALTTISNKILKTSFIGECRVMFVAGSNNQPHLIVLQVYKGLTETVALILN